MSHDQMDEDFLSNEEFQRALITASPVAIYGVDTEDRVIVWNESCEKIFGWREKEVIGKPLPTVPKGEEAKHVALKNEVLSGKKIYNVEVIRSRKNGELINGSLSAAPLYHKNGNLVGIIAVLADITEQKSLEKRLIQSQKLESVGRLAGGIAHDFNNMLMVIKGFAHLLRTRQDPDTNEYSYIVEIEKAVKRASNMTHQLLAFSRKQEMHIETVDLNSILEASSKMLERLIGENIQLRMHLHAATPYILADENQLHQVIVNLTTNARDAMPDGGRLEFKVEQVSLEESNEQKNKNSDPIDKIIEPGEYYLLRVSDTGMGMDPHTLNNLFEPFYTTKDVGKGTGLGLPTAYGIIKQLNGYIFCQSEVGKGTEFHLYFPIAEGEEVKTEKLTSAPQNMTGHEKILLVEDDDMVRRSLMLTLRSNGYTVIEAKNAEEAWNIFQVKPKEIDLLITDIVMTGESGIELAEKIHQEMQELKMVFITGYSDVDKSKRDKFTNKWKNFKKPIEPDELLYEVRKLLDDVDFIEDL